MSNMSLKKLVLRFKKVKDGDGPESENARFHKWMYNSDNRLNVSPVSASSFKKIVSNGRTMKELIGEEEEVKKIVFEKKSEGIIQATSQDCLKSKSKSKSNVDYTGTRSTMTGLEELRKLKNKKIKDIMLKNEEQRKCVDVSKKTSRKKSKPGWKVNAYTPRTLARVECRIKGLEDMKKTRVKMNKEREMKDAFRAYADSFAVLKRSFDPQRDFRESMMEMIMENGIRRREELEELLACYLTLNCDEYHDLIVKVFKDVWLELSVRNVWLTF